MSASPLVLTLRLDQATQTRFDAERRAYFPPGRTAVGVHLTLFHALPGEQYDEVRADVAREADRPELSLEVTGLMPLGRGVAYRLAGPELLALHARLQRSWSTELTSQDRQPLRPHVTVQNKVSPEQARATLAELSAGFQPFQTAGLALQVWRYDGGPWTPLVELPFRPRTTG